mmetsp:Transcript_20100/g.45502  ORF Transcript_20100/g.45502 Transcript_20100/m.45502 type:complete len:357 (-) Transcript_20100:304-1374(-)
MDHGALVRYLRAAAQRRNPGGVRGRAVLPHRVAAVGGGGQVRGDPPLHGAHLDPRPHGARRGPRVQHLPQVPQAARDRRRAHQPRGLAVVLRGGGRLAVPHRGHVVADRDGRAHDQSDAHQRVGAQARLGLAAELRGAARLAGPAGKRAPRVGRPRRGVAGGQGPVALGAAGRLGRPEALRGDLLPLQGLLPHRGRRAPRRGRLLLDHGPRGRRGDRLGAQHRHGRGGVRRGAAPQGGRGRRRRGGPPGQGPGHVRVRDADGRLRGRPKRPRTLQGAQGARPKQGGRVRGAGHVPLHPDGPPQDAEREDHAAGPAQGGVARQGRDPSGPRGHVHSRRPKRGRRPRRVPREQREVNA